MERKLKIILCIVVIVLISIISFVGIYTKDVVVFKSGLPDYILSSDFEGKRITTFKVEDATKEVIYDENGNVVDSIPDGENKEGYITESKPVNSEENVTAENYKKVKEIFTKRLEALGVQDYKIRINENTGDVTVELAENSDTDKILQYISCVGDFSITDSETGDLLLGKDDVKEAKVLYGNSSANGITVYLDIVFNKEGKEKLANVSREYVKVESEKNENESEDSEDIESTETEDTGKKVTLTLEGSKMLETAFDEEITSGQLTISLGKGTSYDDIQSYIEQASFYAMLINNDDLPITFDLDSTNVVKGNLTENDLYLAIGIVVIVSVIIIVYMICRYRVNGIIAGISIISVAAILLIVLRYTNTVISLNSLSAMLILVILDSYIVNKMLKSIKNDNTYETVRNATIKTYLECKEVIIISLIIAVIFTFMRHVAVYTFGMTLFYGIISIALANMLFLRTMLLARKDK